VIVKILGRTDSTQSMMFWMTGMLAFGHVTGLAGWQPLHLRTIPSWWESRSPAPSVSGASRWRSNAPAASVAPLEYTGLAWVMVIDFFVWAAVPGVRTLLGAALIIASGIYLVRHETRIAMTTIDKP
jgi:hypothetical protein